MLYSFKFSWIFDHTLALLLYTTLVNCTNYEPVYCIAMTHPREKIQRKCDNRILCNHPPPPPGTQEIGQPRMRGPWDMDRIVAGSLKVFLEGSGVLNR
jgi:hypothetical protein